MKMESPRDVREFIKDFIVKINSGELDLKNPGVTCQLLNVWLRAYELEQNLEIEKKIAALEKRITENHYERQKEFE
jgi:hypothetical protein